LGIRNRSSHELAPLERRYVRRIEVKPFTVLSFRLEAFVPVGFHAARIIGSDDVKRFRSLGKLYRKFVLPTSGGIRFRISAFVTTLLTPAWLMLGQQLHCCPFPGAAVQLPH
jgi:hypothetical protein